MMVPSRFGSPTRRFGWTLTTVVALPVPPYVSTAVTEMVRGPSVNWSRLVGGTKSGNLTRTPRFRYRAESSTLW